MKKIATLFLSIAFCASLALAQNYAGTGVISYRLTNAGNVTGSSSTPYVHSSPNRQIDRMSIVVAQSQTAVFDYNEDQNSTTELSQLISIPGVDSALQVLTDNSYSELPPNINVRIAIMSWNDQKYFFVRYTIIADTQNLGSMYHGIVFIPKVGGVYGGETIKYSGARKVAYTYRETEANYWGVKALSPSVLGVRAMDWDEYSTDPSSEVTTDSLREYMSKYTSFDSNLVSGSNGSIFAVNTGKNTFTNVGDSVILYFAVGYGTTEGEMFTAMDSASAKFSALITSVHQDRDVTPRSYSLDQNFPNPFNPSTRITFSIADARHVRLSVYDALGREVSTVVDRTLDAGRYSASFDATSLSAGVYYYTLRAGTFVETKKMVLVK
jgi:hypothetical protein